MHMNSNPNNVSMLSNMSSMSTNVSSMNMSLSNMGMDAKIMDAQMSPYHMNMMKLNGMSPMNMPMMYHSMQMKPLDRIPEFKPKDSFSINNYMEEVRNKQRELNLIEIRQNIVELSLDQNGSRIIQQKIENGSPKEKLIIFEEMIQNVVPICNDVFGNYSIQKFLE